MERKSLPCLRFDTCYHGHYYEIFYIFLKINKSPNVPPSVVAHTLPAFFPVDIWEKEYLVNDIQVRLSLNSSFQSFTQCVSLHLNCFIARRQQVLEADKKFAKVVFSLMCYLQTLELSSSDSYCEVRVVFADITLKLHYEMEERYPSVIETVVTKEEELFPQRKKCKVGFGEKEKTLFRTRDLISVLSQLLQQNVC